MATYNQVEATDRVVDFSHWWTNIIKGRKLSYEEFEHIYLEMRELKRIS